MGGKKWVGRFAGGGGKQRALCIMVYVKIVNRDLSGSG